jgi:hypothetical protein
MRQKRRVDRLAEDVAGSLRRRRARHALRIRLHDDRGRISSLDPEDEGALELVEAADALLDQARERPS